MQPCILVLVSCIQYRESNKAGRGERTAAGAGATERLLWILAEAAEHQGGGAGQRLWVPVGKGLGEGASPHSDRGHARKGSAPAWCSQVPGWPSMAMVTGKDALLQWCQERTAPYRRNGISVENFAASFRDGRAFVALVHSQWPSSIAHPDTLSVEDVRTNLNLAFDVAESFGVFKLLDADLIVTSDTPDPKTVMTYLTELRKQFRKADSAEAMVQEPMRSQSMPGMRVVAPSASDDVESLLAGVDLSTLKRPPRKRAQTTAPTAARSANAKSSGPPAIPKKAGGARPPAIPKKKAVVPGQAAGAQAGRAAVQQSTAGVTVAFEDSDSFEKMRTYQLKAECKKRGLPDAGGRDEILARLKSSKEDDV